jgi:glycosyltransferase involved in cell wall biosynthesis
VSNFVPRKVMHIELSLGIPDLAFEPNYHSIYAVFWWYGIPLGHREIWTTQLPIPASQLANLAMQAIAPAVGDRLFSHGFKAPLPITANQANNQPVDFAALMALKQPLKQLQKSYATSVNDAVSVVVCTRNRPEYLAKCLRSLQNLSPPPQQIIVVDNAPNDDATRQLVEQIPGIQYVLEPKPGLSVARNTGIRHSTGDIIAFTDDDAMVHPQWIIRLQQGFQDAQVMAVTGLMLPAELETEAQLIFHQNTVGSGWGYRAQIFDHQFFAPMLHRGVPVWRIGAGVNMAFRRQVFQLVGYFDERLGAGASGCSEDSELWYRILAAGGTCRYEPSAVIYHYHRQDLASLEHQAYQYMCGHVAALLIQFANHQHWGNIRRLIIALPRYYIKRFFQELKRTWKSPQRTTLWAEISGCLSGVKFYLNHRNTPAFPPLPHQPSHHQTTEKVKLET